MGRHRSPNELGFLIRLLLCSDALISVYVVSGPGRSAGGMGGEGLGLTGLRLNEGRVIPDRTGRKYIKTKTAFESV